MAVFFVKRNENTYPKDRELMQIYRVVPQMKRGNYWHETIVLLPCVHTLISFCVSVVTALEMFLIHFLYLLQFWN